MIETKVQIINKAGLHVRPAANLVKIAAKYKSEFFITRNGFRINGKSIIGVMSIAAEVGAILEMQFDGPDENDMCKEIVSLIERGFDEI